MVVFFVECISLSAISWGLVLLQKILCERHIETFLKLTLFSSTSNHTIYPKIPLHNFINEIVSLFFFSANWNLKVITFMQIPYCIKPCFKFFNGLALCGLEVYTQVNTEINIVMPYLNQVKVSCIYRLWLQEDLQDRYKL